MILFTIFLIQAFADFIKPDKANPIVPYRNNENAYTFYDIFLSVSTRISTNGRLEITFPQEFDGTLLRLLLDDIMDVTDQDTNCYIQYTFSTTTTCIPYIEPPVTIPVTNYYTTNNRTLTIFFGSTPLNAGSQKVRIKYNKNPVGLGGQSSGYMQIRTLRDTVEVDSNLNFGTIGFANAYVGHSSSSDSSIINDGSKLGGYTTNYVIQFTTTINLITGSWFRAEIPTGFDITGVTCILVDTQQDLNCTVDEQRIYFGAINAALTPGTHKVKLKNVINPSASGDSDPFIFETLKPLVNTVVEYFNAGVSTITPGQIINPSIAGSPLNQNLRIDYTIKFTPQNKIPYYGRIDYIIPSGFTLDPTCRVISGLSQNGSTPISCITSGQNLTITNFASFSPQEITIKVYATNPPVSALYQYCKIYTYSTFGKTPVVVGTSSNYKGIDQNVEAGSIQISDIQSPYFVAIDLYKPMVNISLDGTGPLDFRLYPMPLNQLYLSESVLSYASIYFQIPLWWRMSGQNFDGWNVVGNIPTCNYGAEIAATCNYYLQKFSFETSSSTNYIKYDPDTGLSNCDLPISVADSRITPIPGRFDFRVLTFNDGVYNTFNQKPLEQDLYTMEIAVDQFVTPNTYVKCTSRDQVDVDMVCYANFKLGLAVPYEGALNFNMSTVNSTYDSSAAWPNDLGFGIANDTHKRIPCYVSIKANHPNVQCWIFSGGLTRKYAILQVRGFSSKINSGTNIFVVIPNVKSCTAYDMQCYITISSAWTTELDEPYTLNYLKQSIGQIVKGDVYYDVTVSPPVLAKDQQDTTLSATFLNTRQQICELTTWTLNFVHSDVITSCSSGNSAYPYCSNYTPDHVLIKFANSIRFPNQFGVTATTTYGTVYLIDHFLTGEYYYFIIFNTGSLAANNPFILSNIYNPILYTPGIDIKLIYWHSNRKQKRITFPTSNIFIDGGILGPPVFDILPKTALGMNADRSQTTDMDFDSWIIFRATFTTCHSVPAGGLIELEVQNGFVDWTSTCNIWSGITSPQKGLGYTHQCNLIDVSGTKYYQLTKFNQVPVLTQITLSFRGKTGLTAITANSIRIRTYFDSTVSTSTASNVDNFYNTAYAPNPVLYGIDINGPKRFPIKLEWEDFIIINDPARQGTRGEFYMHIQTNHDIPSYTSDSTPRMVFTFNTTGIGMPPGGQPHCRMEGHLARYCTWAGGVISMSMPLLYGMTANQPYLFMISTRGADYSASYREGLSHILAGTYKLLVETQNTAQYQFIRKVMTIDPPKFSVFWVWSANKIGYDPNDLSATIQGMSVYRLYFTNSIYIPPSDNPDPISIIIEFDRQIWPTFTNGFEQDLGTGFPHRTQLPCIQIGFNLLSGITQLKCRLFYGSYPNPTKIIITDFDAIPSGTNGEIHIPNIFNPNSTYELTQISLKVQKTDALTGTSQYILNSAYNLINGTFGRTKEQNPFNQLSIDVVSVVQDNLQNVWPAATNPTFSVNTIDTVADLSLEYGSKDYQMGGGADMILFEIPPNWDLPYGMITCSFPGGSICYSYPLGPYIGFYPDNTVSADSLQSGTVTIKTPPFKVLVATSDPPIKIYVFTRSKLVYKYSIDFTQVLVAVQVTPVVTCTFCFYSAITDYTITVTNPKNIPTTGAISITIPTGLIIRENGCRNDVAGGSTLSKIGFECAYDGANSQLIITGFNQFIGPGKIIIKVRMENPASGSITDQWGFYTWYLNESPLNKQVTYGTADSPALNTATEIYYWDTPYRSRVRGRTTLYGSLEFRINLNNILLAGNPLYIELPTLFDKIGCSQFLCLWDPTPWFDNHNDNFVTSEKCLYNKATRVLSMYTPLNQDIPKNTVYRIIIDTQDSVDGNRGFLLPVMGTYTFNVYTDKEYKTSPIFIPQLQDFQYFEAISLISNVGLKNMMVVRFNPATSIPQTSGTFAGGYLKLYFPTLSEESQYLFADDLGTGLNNGDDIQCYPRTGFPTGTTLKCSLFLGNQITGAKAYLKIQGWASTLTSNPAFSSGYQEIFSKVLYPPYTTQLQYYEFDIDQFYNPTVLEDDKHIEMQLESYNGATLLDQGFSYDMTLKHKTLATATLGIPTASSPTLFDTSVTFDATMQSNYQLENTEEYDYFIFEYPQPQFEPQPQNVQCSSGTPYICRVSQGNNWVVIKPKTTISSNQALKLTNTNNPVINPTTGIVCKGYAVKNRVVTAIYTYGAITTYTLPAILSTAYNLIVTPVDYASNTTIPQDTLIKVRIELTIPSQSVTLPYGSYIDIFPPTGFTIYDTCINTYDTQATFTQANNLICTITASSSLTGFTGRPQFTITGFDQIDPGEKIIFNTWVKTGTSSLTTTTCIWDSKSWEDSTRTVQYWTIQAAGFTVQTYGGFKTLEWKIQDPAVAKQNGINPFTFSMSFNSAPTSSSTLTVQFPSSVSIPSGASLFCTLQDTLGNKYLFASCVGSGTLQITMYFPITSTTFTAQTWYQITIDSRGSNTDHGLKFSNSGTFQATITQSNGDTNNLIYEILPSSQFSNYPQLRVVNSQVASSGSVQTALLFYFQTTVLIPKTGQIVIVFPTEDIDGTAWFNENLLSGTTYNSGDIYPYCYTTNSVLLNNGLNCRIFKNNNKYPQTQIIIQGFSADINPSTSLQIAIESVTIPNNVGSLSLMIYTCDSSNNKLEAYIFDDGINPYISTTTSMTPTITIATPTVQSTSQFTFGGINVGSLINSLYQPMTPYATIAIRFPPTYYDISSAQYDASITSTACKISSTVEICAHWLIYRQSLQSSTSCTSVQSFGFSNIKNVNSAITTAQASSQLPFSIFVCPTRVCTYTGTGNPSVTYTAATSGSLTASSLPSNQNYFPYSYIKIEITYTCSGHNIPSGGQVIFELDQTKFIPQKIVLKSGGISSITTTYASGSPNTYAITLGSSYDKTQSSMKFDIYGYFTSSVPISGSTIFSVVVKNRFGNAPISSDSSKPTYNVQSPSSVSSALSYSSITNSEVLSSIVVPGAITATNSLYINIPTFSTSDTNAFTIYVFITGVSGSCSAQFDLGNTYSCTASSGMITVSSIDPSDLTSTFYFTITSLSFSTSGLLPMTVRLEDSSSTVQAVYFGTVILYDQQMSSLSASFSHSTNGGGSNILTIQFTPPTSYNGFDGELFLDLLGSFTTLPTNQIREQCYFSQSNIADCLFQPKYRLSSTTTTAGHRDAINDRIILSKFSTTSSSGVLQIWFTYTYSVPTYPITDRMFQFGYYTKGQGNDETYSFGQNFVLQLNELGSSVPTQSVNMQFSGTAQSMNSITTDQITSQNTQFDSGNYVAIKMMQGYAISQGTLNYMKQLASSVSISSSEGTLSTDSSYTINKLGYYVADLTSTSTTMTVTLSNVEQPYKPTSSISGIVATAFILDTNFNIVEIINFVKSADAAIDAMSTCTFAQIDQKYFEVSFQLNSNFKTFNHQGCVSSGNCQQYVEIASTSAAFNDVASYEIYYGLGTSIITQSDPYVGYPLSFTALSSGSYGFRLGQYLEMNGSDKITLRFRKKVASAATTSFTIKVYNADALAISSCTTNSISVLSTAPSGNLVASVKTLFGLQQYYNNFNGIVNNVERQITFEFSLKTDWTTNGQLWIDTTSLNLDSFDQKNRLKCQFKLKSTGKIVYQPVFCTVNSANYRIIVEYRPLSNTISAQLVKDTVYELIIKYDQLSQKYFSQPASSGTFPFKFSYNDGTTSTIYKSQTINVNVYSSQITNLQTQTYVDHISSYTNYYVKYTASQSISSSDYIDILFPLNKLNTDTTLTALNSKSLGAVTISGSLINCLDKQNNLGTNYKCYLYYGIDTFNRPYSFVRMTGFQSIGSGSTIEFVIQKLQNPATFGLYMDYEIKISGVSSLYEFAYVKGAKFTLPASSAVSSTSGSLSITPTTCLSQVTYTYQVTINNDANVNKEAMLQLTYNSVLWGGDYTKFTAKIGGTTARIDPMDTTNVFIVFPVDFTSGSSVTIEIDTGLYQPIFASTISEQVTVQFINYQTKSVNQIVTQTISQTTSGSIFATYDIITGTSNFQTDPLTIISIPVTLQAPLQQGYTMIITFPTDYTLQGGQCKITDTTTQSLYSTTCSDVDTLNKKIIFNQALATSTQFTVSIQIQTPSSAGATNLQSTFYTDSTLTNQIQQDTLTSLTIGPYAKMICAQPYIKAPQRLLQDGEIGPITLTMKLTASIAAETDYVVIDTSNFLTKTITQPIDTSRMQFACFWNNYAAFSCKNSPTSFNSITIYSPSIHSFAVDDIVTLKIMIWRSEPIGVTDFTYQWHETDGTITSAKVTDITITMSNSSTTAYKKNVVYQNYRFDEVTLPQVLSFAAVHQTTINTFTDFTIRFRLKKSLLSNTGTNWGQIIIQLPTMDDFDNTQTQFPNGLGRFTKNAQEIDCFCSSCAQLCDPDPLTPYFQCFVYQGSSHRFAPVEIWLNPQYNLPAQQILEISFPKIMLPATQYTYTKLNVLAYEYYATNKTTINHTELVHDFTFNSIPDAFSTYTGVSPPTFDQNFVGAKSTVTAQVTNPYDDLLPYCHDRWVLSSDDAETIFEHPYNPESGTHFTQWCPPPSYYYPISYPYDYIDFTTATDHDVIIYKLAKWITFRPNLLQTKSSPQTLNIQKFKNMPYKIPTGVNYKMSLFIDLGQRSYTEYSVFTTATQYRLAYIYGSSTKQMSIDPVPAPAETSAPQTYELKFLPYNKIPEGGKIEFIFPNGGTYDWTFTDQYCTVSQNLQDSGCDIIPASYKIIVKDWIGDYDPNIDGYLSVKFDIVNPTSVQTQIPFNWRTFWDQNQDTWLIDEETFFENTPTTPIIQGGNLIVTLWDRYQHPYIICGGRRGPIRLSFTLRDQDLVYPNDYIEIWMQNTFYPPTTQKYIVCYFNDPNDFVLVNIKSHRCDWTAGANGGTLQIYIPEEIDIHVNHQWELVITTFGVLGGDGWNVRSPSDLYWVTFFAMQNGVNTFDKGWFEAQIPGCPFDSNGFECTSVDWEASNPAGDPSWTILNFTARTENNNIPAGDITLTQFSRLVFEFITQNEIEESWPMDLTNRMGAGVDTAQVACNGMYKISGGNRPLQPSGNTYIQCQNILAAGNAWNNTPSYILGQYYEQIASQTYFHFQIADFRNGYVQGAFQHVKVSVQVVQEDGTFYPQNEHYCWHLPPSLYSPPSPSNTQTANWGPQRTQVALTQIYSYFSDSTVQYLDTIVYDFNYPYTLPMKGYCLQRRINANYSDGYLSPCTPQHYNHWWVMRAAITGVTWAQREAGNFVNPPFVYKQNNPTNDPTVVNNIVQASPLRIYIWRNGILVSNQTFMYNNGYISPTTGQLFITSQTTTNDNAKDTYVRHHMGLHLQTVTSALKYIRMWAPNDYQDIRNCKVNRGLVSPDPSDIDNAITCVITRLPTPIDKWLIEISNFQTYQGHGEDSWMIIDFELKNPATERWTGSWYAKTYESSTNLTYVIDELKGTDGQTWVGESVSQPNLFRVFRNTISFENRRAQTDDYAEMHMRVIPRTSHPPTTSTSTTTIEIWLPLSYDLANGGTAVCTVSNEYHDDLNAVACSISSDRKVTLNTDSLYGLKTECSMVTVTTTGAIGGNGIKLPSTPQDDTFQVFIDSTDSNGVVSREYNYNSAYAAPDAITTATDSTFSIKSTIRETNQYTIIQTQFTAPLDIPAGYSTATAGQDALSAPSIGTLRYKFNTQDYVNNGYSGFPVDLGQSSTNVLCQGFGGITGTLKCTLQIAQKVSPDYPAIILVSGFDYITAGSLVSVHFLNIKNGASYQNNGNVQLSAFLTKGDGTTVELIKDSIGYVPLYDPTYYGYLTYLISNICPSSSDVIINPNTVGSMWKVNISNIQINCTVPTTPAPIFVPYIAFLPLNAGDTVILTFPNEFEFPADSNSAISAIWGSVQMITTVYPLIKTVYFTFPANAPIQQDCPNLLQISQFRGPAYYFTSTYNIGMKLVKTNYRIVDCTITGVIPPLISPPSTQSLTLSSYFAGDIFVSYDFKFSPSYKIPAGGTIDISFPNRGLLNYNHVTSSTPSAVCSLLNSQYISSCVLTTTGIQVTVVKDIPAQQSLEILITGVKNSQYSGNTIASDYVLTMYHPNGEIINQQGFSPFVFYKKKNPGVIYMKLSNTNSFQGVTASYTFVIQNTYSVPAYGSIILKMPKEWASVVSNAITLAKLTPSWTSDALSYTYSIDSSSDSNNYLLIISNGFTWPQGGSLTLLMLKLMNPSFSQTKIFQAQTYYDGVLLDQTDATDQSLKFTYKASVPSLPIGNFTMAPSNAGEVSTYSLTMTSNNAMTSGSTIQIQFPTDTYPSGLTRYDLSLTCNLAFSNGTTVSVPCSAANSKLTVSLNATIDANTTYTLSVVGITNPNYDTSAIANSIDVLTTDANNNVLTYNSGAATATPTAAPQTMDLVKLTTSSTNLQVKANYTLCISTDISIPLGAEVFIDFPQQFTFKSTSYPCYIGADHNNQLLPYDNSTGSPSCTNTNSLRRIAISGHKAAYVGDQNNPAQLCYIVCNIENPSTPGPTNNFVVSIYDPSTYQVVAETFGTLSPNSTLSYSQQGLLITVASIDPLPRYLITPPIKVTLERSVSHTVTLTPQSDEFKFIPSSLVFLPANGPVMYFKIQAIDDANTAVGQKQFSWNKEESSTAKFSEMADSFFQFIDKPTANLLYMTIEPRIFRVALGGTSLPMTLTLSQPAGQDLYVNFTTINPYQDGQLVFQPINADGQIMFPAGTTTYQLTYTTKSKALSGQIQFQIIGQYKSLYTIINNIVNFEILQTDDKIPEVINYYAVNTQRTSMYFRASIDESVTLYYYLTLRGSPVPTMDQIKSNTNLTKVYTAFGNNQSHISTITSNYIYNDVYLDLQGLTEATDYTLFFFVTDLSGNNNTAVKVFNFTTAAKYQPAQFQLTLSNNVDIDKLLSALGLVTGLSSSSFSIISNPSKYTIDGNEDEDVQNILNNQTVTYTIQINPDATTGGISPLEYIRLISQSLDVLQSEIPEVVDQNIFNTAWEYFEYPQEFKYTPILVNVTQDTVYFNVSLRYTGNLYTLVLPQSSQSPSSKQVSLSLNSSNQDVQTEWVYKIHFKYSNKTSTDDQHLYAIFNYTLLFDNSYYTAYFTADNDLKSNPDLMNDTQMASISFKTKREIVIIPKKYLFNQLLTSIIILLGFLAN